MAANFLLLGLVDLPTELLIMVQKVLKQYSAYACSDYMKKGIQLLYN